MAPASVWQLGSVTKRSMAGSIGSAEATLGANPAAAKASAARPAVNPPRELTLRDRAPENCGPPSALRGAPDGAPASAATSWEATSETVRAWVGEHRTELRALTARNNDFTKNQASAEGRLLSEGSWRQAWGPKPAHESGIHRQNFNARPASRRPNEPGSPGVLTVEIGRLAGIPSGSLAN